MRAANARVASALQVWLSERFISCNDLTGPLCSLLCTVVGMHAWHVLLTQRINCFPLHALACPRLPQVYKMCMSIGWNPFYQNKEKTAEPWILHDFKEVSVALWLHFADVLLLAQVVAAASSTSGPGRAATCSS